MEKRRVAPEIRFDGFDDNWEQRKAKEIFKNVSNKNHSNLPVLSASQELGMIRRDEIGIDIKYDKKSTTSYKRVKPGQFVIHLRSFQGGFAWSDIEGITSPAYTILDFVERVKHDPKYWKEVLTSKNFIKRLETVTYGIRDGRSISFADFSTLKFHVPTVHEQQKIGNFFKELDHTIALHQGKLDKLRRLKKAFLQLIFPQNGEIEPRLRFANFFSEWEQRKLKSLYSVYSGQTPNTSDSKNFENASIPWIRTTDLTNSFVNNSSQCISIFAASNLRLLPRGTVVISMYGGLKQIGRTGLLNVSATINQALSALEPSQAVQPYFLISQLNARIEEWKPLAASSRKDPNITKKDVENFHLHIPFLDEQKKISDFFRHLDNTITLHQTKLEKLQLLKKAYLQKMFI